MKQSDISLRCITERERLINTYFGTLPTEQAIRLDYVGDLIQRMEDEYKQFLFDLWCKQHPDSKKTMDDILEKQYNRFSLGREYAAKLNAAFADAKEITLWEQLTNSNDKDIQHMNALIIAYAKDLLAQITMDFMEDVK